jgi:hypothetical protein
MSVRRYREAGVLIIEDDGAEPDPEDYWCAISDFPLALHDAITKTSQCSWNATVLFPPDRPWAAASYEQMFYTAIADPENPDTANHIHLLNVADAVRRCTCLSAEVRENFLLNIRLKL